MPAHLKALAVILVIAFALFALLRQPVCRLAMREADYRRRRNLWFALTLAAFLGHHYWIFTCAAAAMLYYTSRRDPNPFALFAFVLLALPAIPQQVSGLGVVNFLFVIDYYRLLALAVLAPAWWALRRQTGAERFGALLPDKLLLGYLALNFFLRLNVDTFTNTLRYGVFYAFVDTFLPYYVASRALRAVPQFRDALASYVVASLILAAIGAFEFGKRWLLYSSLDTALNVQWDYGRYLMRGEGVLRAQGTAGHAIPLGYAMAVAIGIFLYVRRLAPQAWWWAGGMALLLAGLVAPVSRGPWVGAAAMAFFFVATGPKAFGNLAKIAVIGGVGVAVLLASPAGDTVINHLPFVGTVEAENVTYRQRLLYVSLGVMLDNLLLGSPHYLQSPAMQSMIQGQGIIDMVNTYLGVGLASGLVGLALFSGFFAAVGWGLVRGMRSTADDEMRALGRALLATLLGILIIIFTVSSITLIPVVYWVVAGMGVSYVRMLAAAGGRAPTPRTSPAGPPRFGVRA